MQQLNIGICLGGSAWCLVFVVGSDHMQSNIVFLHCLAFLVDPNLNFLASISRCVHLNVFSLITFLNLGEIFFNLLL